MHQEQPRAILDRLNKQFNLDSKILDRIIFDIHPSDTMYTDNREHYFSVGFSAIDVIKKVLYSANRSKSSIKTMLDFPCGSGRVLRFLRAYFGEISITGSEILQEYLNFCAKTFNINTLNSGTNFKEIKTNESFDLIWCGSLITHLKSEATKDLLQLFSDLMAPNGILIFSSHGRTSAQWLKDVASKKDSKILLDGYNNIGYGYYPYPSSNVYGMPDSEYGMSLIKSSWLFDYLEESNNWDIIYFKEKAWDNNHDIFGCKKR